MMKWLVLALVVLAAPVHAEVAGRLIYAQGRAQLVRGLKPQPLVPGYNIESNDTMRVQIGARMKSILRDDSILMIWEDTEIRLEQADINLIAGRRMISIEQLTGNVRLLVSRFLGASSEILIRTPNARITLDQAGDILVRQGVQGDSTEIIAIAGTPTVEHVFGEFGGSVVLEPQQTTIVGAERAPSAPVFMDRQSFDGLLEELRWTIPQPVPNWSKFFDNKLDIYAGRSFGRIRRLAAKPFIPIHATVEGMADWSQPVRPGDMRPEPTGRLELTIERSGIVEKPEGDLP